MNKPFVLKITKRILRLLFGLGVVALVCYLKNKVSSGTEFLMRSYSVVMSYLLLMSFAVSLFKTPLVEIMERKKHRTMDVSAQRYCRNATVACTIFLSHHFGFTIATLFLPFKVWVVYNGAVAYFLVGAMFLAEYLIRRKILSSRPKQ
jgi:uncharacterized membrane protein